MRLVTEVERASSVRPFHMTEQLGPGHAGANVHNPTTHREPPGDRNSYLHCSDRQHCNSDYSVRRADIVSFNYRRLKVASMLSRPQIHGDNPTGVHTAETTNRFPLYVSNPTDSHGMHQVIRVELQTNICFMPVRYSA